MNAVSTLLLAVIKLQFYNDITSAVNTLLLAVLKLLFYNYITYAVNTLLLAVIKLQFYDTKEKIRRKKMVGESKD